MTTEALVYIFSVFAITALLFLMVYFVIMFSDLEADYINPIDLCERLNQVVFPETILHGILVAVLLATFEFVSFALQLPLFLWTISRYVTRRQRFDPTEIFRELPKHKRTAFIKLGFFLVSFFYFLYRMIWALVNDDDAAQAAMMDHEMSLMMDM